MHNSENDSILWIWRVQSHVLVTSMKRNGECVICCHCHTQSITNKQPHFINSLLSNANTVGLPCAHTSGRAHSIRWFTMAFAVCASSGVLNFTAFLQAYS